MATGFYSLGQENPVTQDQDGSGIGDVIGGLLTNNFGDIAGGLGGMAAINAAYNRLGDIGDRALAGANIVAQRGLEQAEFVPFTVTTGMGGNVGVSPSLIDIASGQGDVIGSTLLGNAASRFGTPVPEAASRLMGAGESVLDIGQSQLGQAPALGADLQGASSALLSTGRSDLMRSPFGLAGQQRAADQPLMLAVALWGERLLLYRAESRRYLVVFGPCKRLKKSDSV